MRENIEIVERKTKILTNKQTICFLTDYFVVGGVERVIIDTIKLLKERYDITLWIMTGGIDFGIKEKLKNDITIKFGNKTSKIFNSIICTFPILGKVALNQIIREKFDYLIVVKQPYIMASYSKIARKIIFWNHGDKDILYSDKKQLSFFRKMNKIRLGLAYRKFDKIWVLSEEISKRMEEAFHLNNVCVLSNPIDTANIIEKAYYKVEENIFSKCGINIIMVGRLSLEKGYDRVIEVLGKMNKDLEIHLIIIGNGSERNRLEQIARDSGIFEKTYFLGSKKNPYSYIRQADLLICPSYTESFGLVMLEAMLLKVPVLTTDTVGGKNITCNGKYGKCIENSKSALEKALYDFIENPTIYQKYIVDAHERALSFDKKYFERRIKELLRMEME